MQQTFDAIILGGGAAGLMCALEAGKRGRRVVVLEQAERIGKKILISGGGRCNFTNLHCRPENFLSANPHFCKSALARYTPADLIALVEKHRIPYHEKTLGQLFCDGSAREIVAMLETECRTAGVTIQVKTAVHEVQHNQGFNVRTAGAEFRAPALVVATGGLSIPKMGATSFGYDLAQQFGLRIQECRPGLVPFILNAGERQRYCDLAGLSTEVIASVDGNSESFREKMLFTHRGLSGPAMLQISSYWRESMPLSIDLAPERELTAPLRLSSSQRNMATAKAALRGALPQRLADRWLDLHPPSAWTNHGLAEFEREIHHWKPVPADTEGYEKAEVTVGGIDTNELSAKTMESRKVPGLYFIGEVVDVTGHLGGFNFQWAWASGFCAGRSL
ncbi:MAG TPA: NAD(P)/FAD-dependent oxidoreductase [Candidatus Angelobacter sp.]|jgi:predicted Rossmann fold flavoprotein|nr:NAD(P)/FAD-dependent oxidoreductase [Candidatus Angelobacter sp.]